MSFNFIVVKCNIFNKDYFYLNTTFLNYIIFFLSIVQTPNIYFIKVHVANDEVVPVNGPSVTVTPSV